MSAHVDFDIAGLLAAIERGDLAYQLALYATDAVVRVAASDPEGPVTVYRGKEAILTWLQMPECEEVTHRLSDLTSSDDGILLTDVIRHPDGRNVIHQLTLHVNGALIREQDVIVIWEDLPA